MFERTGQTLRWKITSGNKPPLRVCLAWTDLPARGLQNQLLLLMDDEKGRKFVGNQDAAATLKISGMTADPNNNVQIVRTETAEAGVFTIVVTATNLLDPSQSFALVVTGDLRSTLFPLPEPGPMFKLHVIPVQFGDSLLLEFGASDDPHYILVDGGPVGHHAAGPRTALAETPGPGGTLDLLVANQIDYDHIVGVRDLLAEIEDDQVSGRPLRLDIANLWRNTFDRALDFDGGLTQELQSLMSMAGAMKVAMPLAAGAFFGVQQGNRLRLAAQKLGISQNRNFRTTSFLRRPRRATSSLDRWN